MAKKKDKKQKQEPINKYQQQKEQIPILENPSESRLGRVVIWLIIIGMVVLLVVGLIVAIVLNAKQ